MRRGTLRIKHHAHHHLRKVVAHRLDLLLLRSGQVTHLAGGNAAPQLAAAHRLVGRHDGAGSDGRSLADVGEVEDGGSLADQAVVVDGAGVDDRAVVYSSLISLDMTDDHVLANHRGEIVVHVDHHIVLDVGVVSDLESTEIRFASVLPSQDSPRNVLP